eukprot:403331985
MMSYQRNINNQGAAGYNQPPPTTGGLNKNQNVQGAASQQQNYYQQEGANGYGGSNQQQNLGGAVGGGQQQNDNLYNQAQSDQYYQTDQNEQQYYDGSQQQQYDYGEEDYSGAYAGQQQVPDQQYQNSAGAAGYATTAQSRTNVGAGSGTGAAQFYQTQPSTQTPQTNAVGFQSQSQNMVSQQNTQHYSSVAATTSLEEFNSDKSLMRMTTDRVPNTNALQKEIDLPLGIIVKPYGDLPTGEETPAVSFGQKPIVRCKDCRGYVNPFIRFIENGMKWICNICGDINPTDNYYYSPLNSMGQRQDYEDRVELRKGSVDFVASNEYMNRPPMPPTYVFVLDVSKPAIDTGYLALAASTIKSVIESKLLPGGERTKIGFITYDSSVHFYNLRSTLKQPQMFVTTDIDQIFLPQPDDLLVNLTDSYDLVINLLDNLPSYFAKTQIIDNCFVAALQAANMVASAIGGKLIFFQLAQTIIKHPMLAPKTLPNTAERLDLVNSTNPYFSNTGSELGHMHMSCDLFIFTHGKNQYKNLQTFADLARKSSGNLYYYQDYLTATQGLKFSNELYHSLVRRVAWEGVFRIRTSQGFNQIRSFGNIQIKHKTADLILCPSIDADRVLVYEIEKNDLLNEDPNRMARRDNSHLYIQTALLYSTSEGERRIRVHNIAVPLTNMKHLPFEYIDVNATTHYFARAALNILQTNLNFTVCRGMIEMNLTKLCRSMLKSQQSIKQSLPDNLQYLVLYVLGLLKSPFMTPSKQILPSDHLDQLNYLRFIVNGMSPEETLPLFNPQIISIADYNLNDQVFPALENLDRASIKTEGIYMCYNSLAIYFYVGRQCDPYFIQTIFKANDVNHINRNISEEEIFAGYETSPYLTSLYGLVNQFRYQRQPYVELKVLVEGDAESELTLRSMLVVDNLNPGYPMDFTKFLATITGGGPIGPGATTGGAPAAYY